MSSTCGVCGEPADLKCSACKLVSYCGKEHQKNDWKNHKTLCRPVEVSVFLNRDFTQIRRTFYKFGNFFCTTGENKIGVHKDINVIYIICHKIYLNYLVNNCS